MTYRCNKNGLVWVVQDDAFLHPTVDGSRVPLTAYGANKEDAMRAYAALFSRSTSFQSSKIE